MKTGKITYYASNDSMGESSPDYCNKFRAFAEQQLFDRYGDKFDVEVLEKQTMNETDVDFYDAEQYDGSVEREIQESAGYLWDAFGKLPWDESDEN